MRSSQGKLHILLVNPKTPASYWGMQDSTWFVGARVAHIPLGAVTVAGMLPRNWELKLVDLEFDRLTDRLLRWADIVFVTGMGAQSASQTEVLHRCRELGVPTVVGGSHVSSAPNAPGLDLATSLAIGEAEGYIGELVADIEAGTLKPVYRSEERPDITTCPTPRYDLLKTKRYCGLSLQVSRGCPHGCEFCNVRQLFGRRMRYKTPGQVIAELDAIKVAGFHGNVFVVDDNFIGSPRKTTRMLEAIRDWWNQNGRPFLFYTQADIRLAERDDLISLMTDAGFYAVFIGFESPSDEALRCSAKRQNVGVDAEAAVRHLRRSGLQVFGGFIVGFDTDGPEIAELTYEMIENCGIDFAMAGMLIALPGTPLEQRLRDAGRLAGECTGDQFEISNIIPRGMSRLELVTGYRRLMERLYGPRQYFDRAFTALSEWQQKVRRTPSWQEWLAVGRSVLRQGMFSTYAHHYWSFLLKTLRHFPSKFPRAFSMAICGHHLLRYTKRTVLPRLREAERQLAEEAAEVA
ncbi:B12-binding domain-containing radical SAM protein [Patescibacteria group bacterium]